MPPPDFSLPLLSDGLLAARKAGVLLEQALDLAVGVGARDDLVEVDEVERVIGAVQARVRGGGEDPPLTTTLISLR